MKTLANDLPIDFGSRLKLDEKRCSSSIGAIRVTVLRKTLIIKLKVAEFAA